MNLRILKKKSQQAKDILQKNYKRTFGKELFIAERGESYHGLVVRSKCPCRRTKNYCYHAPHPLPGTLMIGGLEGYYEPEWTETTLFSVLYEYVMWEGRPDNITDRQWKRIMAVAGITDIDLKLHNDWVNDLQNESEVQEPE